MTILTAVVLEVADSTIVNTALPAIRDGLQASPAAMQWIIAGYLLALGSLLLIGGRLGDAFGYSRVFLWGVAGFVAASALCGLAQTPAQLVAARVVQGLAGAVMAPQTMALVQILYTPVERIAKLAYFGLIVGLAAIVGPIAGGLLIELDLFGLGWRLIFLINLPIGLAAILVGRSVLPGATGNTALRIDPFGAAIFIGGFGGLLYGLIGGRGGVWRWSDVVLSAAAAGLIGWGWIRAVARRRRGLPAIIEPALFGVASFRWGLIASFFFSAAAIGFLLVFAVSLQQGLGLSPLDTALVHIPFGAGVMLGIGLLVPRLLPRMGKRLPVAGGIVMVVAVALVLRLIARGDGGSGWLIGLLAVAGLGMGTLSGPLGPIVVAEVDHANAGTASATLRTAQQIGGALGIAIVGAAYFSVAGDVPLARLAGLRPAVVTIVVLLLLATAAAAVLPQDIFGRSRRPPPQP